MNAQNGQTYREYEMDRDGFTLLAIAFNGKKARQFKLAYIADFNRMEAEPKQQAAIPASRETFLAQAVLPCPFQP